VAHANGRRGWTIKNQMDTGRSAFYGTLAGGGANDLYLLGSFPHGISTVAYHFDGAAWNRFQLDGSDFSPVITSFWARPWGPRWALNRSDAFEWDDTGWHDRGPMPTTLAGESPGPSAIGSDGTDVFATGEWVHSDSGQPAIWVYRRAP
jgi:hypothetical protein